MKKNLGRPRAFEPEDFLKVAMECFWSNGYQGTSISSLMQASGLASASIYKLYPDKRSVFFAALTQYMETGLARLQQRSRELDPEAALRETLEYGAMLSTGEAGKRGCLTIATVTELLPGDREVQERVEFMFSGIRQNLETIFRRGQQQQVFRSDTPAEVMAETVFMLLEGMRVYGKVEPELENLKRTNDFIMRSVLQRHAAS
ncbi:TetR/AcrR family transcriptional regulator [Rouxiella badensis]|uniref:TetR/AcrR family transcriptional regulator n=1 Tax=Rouxiella badensis TaxID=1646377 RepID=UPI0013EEFC71|nr:TetR/AcrR family transcriptional regulator [Rouxiella badensis]QII37614.1 TetR/AcrR family transcriptional regulator [Rouxiella badensis]